MDSNAKRMRIGGPHLELALELRVAPLDRGLLLLHGAQALDLGLEGGGPVREAVLHALHLLLRRIPVQRHEFSTLGSRRGGEEGFYL
jgi:hypothetical protein